MLENVAMVGLDVELVSWRSASKYRHGARALALLAALSLASSSVARSASGAAPLRTGAAPRVGQVRQGHTSTPNVRELRSHGKNVAMQLRGGGDTQSAVEDAINTMRSQALDAGRQNEHLLEALKLILLYTENIIKNPSEPKFRRIKASNKGFLAKVVPIRGSVDVLAACGFVAVEEAPAGATATETFYKLPADADLAVLGAAVTDIKAALAFSERVTSETLGAMITTGVEEGVVEEVWRLSSTLEGHTADVRGVAVTHDNKIVTCSRDDKLKLWVQREQNPNKLPTDGQERGYIFEETAESTHDYHVACAATAAPTTKFPNGLALTGTYDFTSSGTVKNPATVKLWDAEDASDKGTLLGHTGTVSAISVMPEEGGDILSASWDKTIKMWDRSTLTMKKDLHGHSQAVWALLPMHGSKLLSGSGDRTIKLWDTHEGKCLGTLTGHGDCVRALAMLPDGNFVSAGNDCMIKIWSLDLSGNSLDTSCGFCLGTLAGHDNFIYTLAVLPNGDIVSGGEDRTVRVWHESKCVACMRFPNTVWSVAITKDGDIAVGCADGKTRVFTQNEARMAPELELKAYDEELAQCTINAHTMGGLQLDKLPGPEALEDAGKTDGQTRVVRQGDKAFAYSWSATANKWEPVGEVVDSQGSTENSVSGGKQSLNGKDFDFVFEIEIEEGKKAKLGVNKGDNPYVLASNFIDDHDLNQDYLETIVGWLDEQMDKVCPKDVGPEKDLLDSDPFNDGKVYKAGSAKKKNEAAQTYFDPLTGKRLGANMGEDSDSDDDKRPVHKQPPVTHIPSSTLHTFAGAPKAEALIKKLGELNAVVDSQFKLTDEEFAKISTLCNDLADPEAKIADDAVDLVVGKMLSWPSAQILPALDLSRALLMNAAVASKLGSTAMAAYSAAYAGEGGATPDSIAKAQQQDVLLKLIMASASSDGTPPPPPAVVFMAMRAICNGFLHNEMKNLLQLHLNTASMVFKGVDTTHKQVQLAHASLLNNYAVLFKGLPMLDSAFEAMMSSSVKLLKSFTEETDVQAMYRVCCAAGTLITGNATRIARANTLKIQPLVREKVLSTDVVKGGVGSVGCPNTQRCCYALLETFDVVRYMEPGLKVADNDDEFQKIVKYAGGKPVIIDFAASWCGPCKVIGPVFDALAAETPQAVFVKVDVDQCRATATKYKVEAMPTFKLLHMGKEMTSIQGANEAGLKQLVAQVVAASGGPPAPVPAGATAAPVAAPVAAAPLTVDATDAAANVPDPMQV